MTISRLSLLCLTVFTQKDRDVDIFTLKPDFFFSPFFILTGRETSQGTSSLHVCTLTITPSVRTKRVQGPTAGDGGVRNALQPSIFFLLLWRCGFEFTATSISTLDSPQIGGVKADLNPDALHWCFHFSLLEMDQLSGHQRGEKMTKVVLFWVHYLSRDDVLRHKQLGEKTGFQGRIAHKQDVGWKWWKWQSTRLRTCEILHAPAAAVNLSPFEAHRRDKSSPGMVRTVYLNNLMNVSHK